MEATASKAAAGKAAGPMALTGAIRRAVLRVFTAPFATATAAPVATTTTAAPFATATPVSAITTTASFATTTMATAAPVATTTTAAAPFALAATIALAIALAAPAARAQPRGAAPLTLPDPSDTLRAATQRPTDAAPLRPAAELQFTSQTPPANARDLRFTLAALELEGGSTYPDALRPLYADRVGTEIDVAELFAIAAAIQARYRADGHLFTRVLVPAQRIEDGRVRIEVIEAVIASVEIEEPGLPLGPVRALADRIVAPLRGLENPRAEDIERVLLLLNDIPGVIRAAALPRLGAEARGAVDLFINMEREALGLTVFADNRQSPIIGPGLLGAVASINSWSAAGDSTRLSAFVAAGVDEPIIRELRERWTLQIEHRRVIDPRGVELRGRALYSESEPGGTVADFDIVSDQLEAEVAVYAPLRRTRALSLDLMGGLEAVAVNSRTPAFDGAGPGGVDLVTEDRLWVAKLRLGGLQRDALGFTEGLVEFRRGLDIGGASRAGDDDLSRSDGDGAFWSVRGELARSVALPRQFTLWGKGWGQWADRPLLSSEEMSIGGPLLGRAFHPSEAAGDTGLGAAVELRWSEMVTLGATRMPVELYGFADWGKVHNLDGGAPESAELVSAGFGVRAQLPNRFAVNLEAAKPINRPLAYNQSDGWRLLVSAAKEF